MVPFFLINISMLFGDTMKKLNTDEFIKRSILKHGNIYDYKHTVYVNASFKVDIECIKHGLFQQLPHSHMNISGCPLCSKEKQFKTTTQFVDTALVVHNGKYDYHKSVYIHSKKKIIIICHKHGDFLQSPNPHLKGHGCPQCKKEILSHKLSSDKEKFIINSNFVHNYNYTYENVVYKNNKTKVQITCMKHGNFNQRPDSHLSGSGCPECNLSRAIRDLSLCLKNNNISFIFEKRFSSCKNKSQLPFDIFIENLNVCIEYDGIQHFEVKEHWGGLESLKQTNENDFIKTQYCLNNGINLLRIKYNEDHISVLKEYFKNTFNIDLKD